MLLLGGKLHDHNEDFRFLACAINVNISLDECRIKWVSIDIPNPNYSQFVVGFAFATTSRPLLQVSRYPDPRDACSVIAAESYRLWLEYDIRTDDITIIVVHIKNLCNVS